MHYCFEQSRSSQGRLQILFHLLIALSVVAISGCGSPDRHRLVGKWHLEEPTRLENQVADVADLGPKSELVLDFRRGGRFYTRTSIGNIQSEKQGTWRVVGFDEATNILKIECKIGGESNEHAVEFLAEDLIELVPPNMAGTTKKLKFRHD